MTLAKLHDDSWAMPGECFRLEILIIGPDFEHDYNLHKASGSADPNILLSAAAAMHRCKPSQRLTVARCRTSKCLARTDSYSG